MIYLFFLIFLQYTSKNQNLKKTDSIQIKARSLRINNQIKHFFSFYYGNEIHRYRYISSEIDLNYKYTLFTSYNIHRQGLICSIDYNCQRSKKPHYIYDNIYKNLIQTNPGIMPLYLNPIAVHQTDKEYIISSKIEIKSNNEYYNFKNVVGFNYQSNFLEYLSILYEKEKIYIRFNLDLKNIYNPQELLANPSVIDYDITFFEKPKMQIFYHQSGKSFIINNFAIKGLGIKFEKLKVTLDLQSPYLMEIPEKIYTPLIKKIKSIICNNPYICKTKDNIFPGYDNNLNLNFITPKNDLNKKNHIFPINIDHLYYIDKENNIQYNFKINSKPASVIKFGLIFLNRVNLYVEYHKSFDEKSFHFYFYKKSSYHHFNVISFILFGSFLISILFTFLVVKFAKAMSPTYLINKDISLLYLDSEFDDDE